MAINASRAAVDKILDRVYKKHLMPAYGELMDAKKLAAKEPGLLYDVKGWIQDTFTKMLEPFDVKCEDPEYVSEAATAHQNNLRNMPASSIPYMLGPSRKRSRVEPASQPNLPNVRFPRGGATRRQRLNRRQ